MMRSIRKKEGWDLKAFLRFKRGKSLSVHVSIFGLICEGHPTGSDLRSIKEGEDKKIWWHSRRFRFFVLFLIICVGKCLLSPMPAEVLRNKQLQWVWEEGTLSPRVMDRGDFFHLQWWPRQRSIKLKKETIKNNNQEQKGNRGALSPLGLQSNDGFGINGKKVSEFGVWARGNDGSRPTGGVSTNFHSGHAEGSRLDRGEKKRRHKYRVKKSTKMGKERLGQLLRSNFKPCIR